MPTDYSVSTDTGLSDPTLAFGLTTVSDYSTQMAFLDLMKMSRPWIGHTNTAWSAMTTDQLVAGGYLDADGWPTRIPDGLSSIGTIWAWGNAATADPVAAASRAGTYVLSYEGEGTLQIQGQGITILSSEPGRIVVQNLLGGQMMLNITSTDPSHSGNYLRNISLVPQEYEALHEAGQIFNPDWLALVQDARQLRFMDWMVTNGSNQVNWDDRPEIGDVTWAGKSGVPVEVMVQLANQTGTEPWFNIPVGASADYILQFATYVRDHLDPGLKVHVEFANEAWNPALPSYGVLKALSEAEWGVTAPMDYFAKCATEAALIWDQVFGASADDRVDNVIGTQTMNSWIAGRIMVAPNWLANEPDSYVAPSSVFDSLAITTYFGGANVTVPELRAQLLAMIADPDKVPQVHIRGDVNAPWRCVAGTIYNVQVSGYPTVGFISTPVDPNG